MNTKKAIRIALIAVPALVVLLVVATLLMLRTQTFSRFLLAKIVRTAEQSTGAHIVIQNLDLRSSPFTADFYGVVVHGRERNDEPPLLQAEHLRVSLGIRALLKKQVDLYAITVDRPVVHVRVDARGNTNLPHAPPSNSSSNETVVVRHASLKDGTINYNDQQIPLSAELDDFQAALQFDATANKYRGSLGYRQGRVVTSGLRPVEHNARLEFVADRDGAILDPVVISTGKTRLTAHLNVVNFSNPAIDGKYEGIVVTQELAEILKNPSLPNGDIGLVGTLNYQSVAKQPFLKTVRVSGRLDSQALAVRSNQISAALHSIHGMYQLQNGDLRIQKLDADLFQGHLSAQMNMLHLDRDPASTLTAAVRGVSLASLSDAMPPSTRQNVRLLGRLNLSAQANWSKDISAMKARSHLEITGPNALPPNQIKFP